MKGILQFIQIIQKYTARILIGVVVLFVLLYLFGAWDNRVVSPRTSQEVSHPTATTYQQPAFEQKVLLPGQETPIDTPSGYRTTFNLREQGGCVGIRTTQGSIRYCEDGKKYRIPNGSVMYFRPEGTEPLTLVFTREKL